MYITTPNSLVDHMIVSVLYNPELEETDETQSVEKLKICVMVRNILPFV